MPSFTEWQKDFKLEFCTDLIPLSWLGQTQGIGKAKAGSCRTQDLGFQLSEQKWPSRRGCMGGGEIPIPEDV